MRLRPLLKRLHCTVGELLASTVVEVDGHVGTNVEKLILKPLHLSGGSNHGFGVLLTDCLLYTSDAADE